MSSSKLSVQFVSEAELEERRRKRQEEWEKARAAGRDVPHPDEVVDKRPLFERLREQRQMKEDDENEKLRAHNLAMHQPTKEQVEILSNLEAYQRQVEDQKRQEEIDALELFRKEVSKRRLGTADQPPVGDLAAQVHLDPIPKPTATVAIPISSFRPKRSRPLDLIQDMVRLPKKAVTNPPPSTSTTTTAAAGNSTAPSKAPTPPPAPPTSGLLSLVGDYGDSSDASDNDSDSDGKPEADRSDE
ncbi:hypothetical protein BJ085DRAFT_30298 [Dimargaris cristalligena]|uniref:FAM192A/Fyv6 N-terminal domain-containing protein n=1 Tax=Dimargaris cristalligena TaxID=215637 RepID=A0A4V1J5I9_9FUNG|nr:hypothetical protein BJ085DRAFT_30298 [Dimargaris cristalligena]|eukprot:RKP39219.1 hypothetical protein BJ085DRAFT_30298 [Dimargaris cristalligena]